MSALDRLPLRVWLAYWRYRQRYHRYTVEGIEHLDAPRAMLIVGYHGRPLAYDLCMLSVTLYDRLGYLPHGVVHRGFNALPPLKWFADGRGFVTREDGALARVIERGEHIVVTPGGAWEGARSFRDRYRVRWGRGVGYLRLALKYHLPIVPVGAAGVDDTYIGLNEAEPIGRRLGLPRDWAWLPWLGLGPLGPYPLSPPFPVRIRQLIGEPIDLQVARVTAADDPQALLGLHTRVQQAVQDLLDRARGKRRSSSPSVG